MKSLMVDLSGNNRMSEKSLKLRCKCQIPIPDGVEERLLAHAVASQKQPLHSVVPDGKGEHSAQSLWRIAAVLFIRVHNDFSIGSGIKGMAALFQLGPQLLVVVD